MLKNASISADVQIAAGLMAEPRNELNSLSTENQFEVSMPLRNQKQLQLQNLKK